MSFGFSVGDVVTVGKLIADIISSLRDTGGSKSEYQEIVRELETLNSVLKHIDQLKPSGKRSESLDSIKYAALSCRQPLEQFLGKIRKYENGLGIWGKRGGIGLAKNKLQWTFGHKEEIHKLQSYLNVHVGTINILLAEHGLEKMDIASGKFEADTLHIRERLESTRGILQGIKDSVAAQAAIVRTTHTMLARLFQMVTGELKTSLVALGEAVARVCVTTQQTHSIVLEMQSSMGAADIRWTFFQAPIIVEDALGFKFPVPSEFDYGYLEAIIKHRFLEGPGSHAVKAGNYEIFATRNSAQVISEDFRLRPGTALTMAILVNELNIFDSKCPMQYCRSSQTSLAPGGGRICGDCDVRFERSKKERKDVDDMMETGHHSRAFFVPGRKPTRKRAKLSQDEDEEDMFRNVRSSMSSFEGFFRKILPVIKMRQKLEVLFENSMEPSKAFLEESLVSSFRESMEVTRSRFARQQTLEIEQLHLARQQVEECSDLTEIDFELKQIFGSST